ncbi:MAG: bifunctional hydroxymethylpyrimidine kinase/phosphomethylpyrimidine kinase [Deltaproteobacteria bacterium]|nr:bifunctional hydroxymethylpyrimidine kinase/phosphomethylpyrimidine kinase [Deltaproteobacteria bacterium]
MVINKKPRILTIAGSDPSGGAGIQADLKVIALLGGYGTSVITALTAQNTEGVQGVLPVPPFFIKKQLQSVLSDIDVDAVKTGMLVQSEVISLVAQMIKKYKVKKLVVDPVMVSGSGHSLLEGKAVQILKDELFPIAGLITPNLSEASVLSGLPVRTLADMKRAARVIKEKIKGNVLIKGGHLSGAKAAKDLFFDGASFLEFSSPRIRTSNIHGTGCTFSAAITTYWAQGFPLIDALGKAKAFITKAIAGAQPVGHGLKPTDPHAGLAY